MFDNDKEIIKELENRRLIDSSYRIVRWPRKQINKNLVLKYLSGKIKEDIIFSEFEINHIILQWQLFDDYALTRREMFENNLINRTNDCKEYWREKET